MRDKLSYRPEDAVVALRVRIISAEARLSSQADHHLILVETRLPSQPGARVVLLVRTSRRAQARLSPQLKSSCHLGRHD